MQLPTRAEVPDRVSENDESSASATPPESVAGLSRAVELSPERFLRSAAGSVRGFWGSGDRWIAFSGAAVQVSVDGEAGLRRFRLVRTAARSIATGWRSLDSGETRPPRLLGGFAFRPLPGPTEGAGLWASFPAARFVVPTVEVEGGPDGTVVRVQGVVDPGTTDDRLRESLGSRLAEVLDSARRVPEVAPVPALERVTEATDSVTWTRSIERVLARIRRGEISKVVVARAIDLELESPPDPVAVLSSLRRANPRSDLFFFEFSPGSAFLGAAPELLASRSGTAMHAMAVAGSAPRSRDPEQDDRLGRELLASEKNRLEHRIGVEDMRVALEPWVDELRVDASPRLHKLAGIQHLRTDLSGWARAECHILDLVEALHPTAAVCGHPRRSALEVIRSEEPEERGWYAGPVGWLDGRGDGEFSPALRSAIAGGNGLRLYAGAGIVTGSRPDGEWEETRVKFRTMLRALGIRRVP